MTPERTTNGRMTFLARLGLHTPETRAWAMYDWAVSAVQTTVMVAVFPIYFKQVAAVGVADSTATAYVATANSIAERGAMSPVTSGRPRVRLMSASMSRSMTMLMAFAPPAARVPPTSVSSTRRVDGHPRCASTMVGTVVMSNSSTTRSFMSATYPVSRVVGWRSGVVVRKGGRRRGARSLQ